MFVQVKTRGRTLSVSCLVSLGPGVGGGRKAGLEGYVVARGSRSPLFAMHGGRVPPRSFPPQRRAILGMDAVRALFAHRPAFTLQQHPDPAIPEPHPRRLQLGHDFTLLDGLQNFW